MTLLKTLLGVIAVSAVAAGSASALTITNTYNGTGSITFLDMTLPLTTPVPTLGAISFPSIAKFDTTLGILTNIKFQVSGDGNVPNAGASFILVSLSTPVPALTFTIGGNVSIPLPGGSPTTVTGTLSGMSSSTALPVLSSGSFASTASGPVVTTTNPIDFAQFSAVGGGSVSIPTVTITPTFAQSPGFSTQIDHANLQLVQGVDLTVTYTYITRPPVTPMPEPMSMALLGFGLAGMVMVSRRRA